MDSNQNQTDSNLQQQDQPPKPKWLITEAQAEFLAAWRTELINQRAYEVLKMTQETMFDAAQAAGYSRGRLALVDELLECAQIVRQD